MSEQQTSFLYYVGAILSSGVFMMFIGFLTLRGTNLGRRISSSFKMLLMKDPRTIRLASLEISIIEAEEDMFHAERGIAMNQARLLSSTHTRDQLKALKDRIAVEGHLSAGSEPAK